MLSASSSSSISLFRMYLFRFMVFAIALFVFQGESFGQTATLTDDVYFRSANKNNNRTLVVEGSPSNITYLLFDLTPDLPQSTLNTHIGKATLKLYVDSLPAAGSFRVYRVTSPWDETSSGAAPTYDTSTVWATGAASTPDSFVAVDLTALVKRWLGDDGLGLNGFLNFGIAVVSNGVSAVFNSKESTTTSHAPQLDIVLNHAVTADTSTSFSGPLAGDVTGIQNSTVVSSVGGRSAGAVASATDAANGATSTNTVGAIVRRDALGNFFAGTISGSLNGNAATVTNGVVTTGSYADPLWITSLAGSKIIGMPNDSALVHLAGAETITGAKTFVGFQSFGGNVGIGMHGPSSTTLLNVGGNTGVVAGTFINNHNTSGNDALLAIHTGIGNAIHAQNTQATGRAGFFETGHPLSSSPALETLGQGVGPAFKASNTSTGPAAIFTSGNVGIGTASPTQKLDVVGNINASGSVSAASFSGNGAGLSGVTSTTLNCTSCIGNTQLGVNYAGSSSQGGAATSSLSANEATNALALGGVAASGYAPASGSPNYVSRGGVETITGAKTFDGFQTFTGSIGVGQHGPSSTTLLNVGGNTGVVAGTFINNHNTSGNDALLAIHTGIGNAFHAQNTQASGRAGFFETGHPLSSSPALETLGQGVGPAFKASNTSTGPAAIFTSGNVGIGTATPSQKLEVAGNINASGSVSAASFSGNGAGLTGISSTALNCTGCVGNTQLADGAVTSPKISAGAVGTSQLANNAVNANHITDGAVTASKIGVGQIVKSLNNLKDDITLAAGSNITLTPSGNTLTIAATAPASTGWSLTGNPFTDPSANFLGTTDNVAQEFRVNNQRAFRLEPNTSPNLIGGFSGNTVTQGALGATIGGGGISNNPNRVSDNFGTVGGGNSNLAGDNAGTTGDRQFATVGGGRSNTASGDSSTVGGGFNNLAQFIYNTVGGGFSNSAIGEGSTIAGGMGNTTNSRAGAVGGGEVNFSGGLATVGGGQYNTASGGWSTVPGGSSNIAGGEYSFAAGRNAQINGAHGGSFLFSDANAFTFTSAATNEFAVRATGGFRFVTGIGATGDPTSTWSLSSSGIRFPDGTTQTTAATGNGAITGVTAGTGLVGGGTGGNVTLGIANGGVNTTQIGDNAVTSSKISSGHVVKGLNGLTDAVTLAAGSNITITSSGNNTLTIADSSAGTAVYTTGSYADPSWITSLSGSKITGSLTPTSIFSRTNSNNDVIFGLNDGYGVGVHGFSTGGYGVAGYTNSNVSAGVYGANPVGDAGRFDGNVIVSGNVGIGTTTPGATLEIKVGGTTLADAWITRSSARFKTNVQPITAALDKLLQLRGVTFNWKDTQRPSIGFIAEEVARVLPEAVEFEKNGVDAKGLDYSKLTPLLVEAIKAQQKKLEELQQENARLQTRNAEQEARFNRLEGVVKAMIQKASTTPEH